ncbi:MAG: hypothetical protein SWH78_10155 [Thermodesulfobacteriota bacterium]|nr:hypothetical protein [Thermodesulfobacteriota bacterium]
MYSIRPIDGKGRYINYQKAVTNETVGSMSNYKVCMTLKEYWSGTDRLEAFL